MINNKKQVARICSAWFLKIKTLALCGCMTTLFTGVTLFAGPKAFAQSTPEKQLRLTENQKLAVKVVATFESKCLACHGKKEDEIEGGFDMRSRQGLLKGGESGNAAIVPGKPTASPLLHAIEWSDLEMPPKENDRLTPEQIAMVRQWIAIGAPWPSKQWQAIEDETEGITVATSGGLSESWSNRRYDPKSVWAYQPLKIQPVPWDAGEPAKLNSDNPIDAFIAQSLNDEGIVAAERADWRTLLRRASYDLTGLPPSTEATRKFLKSPSEERFRQYVQELLDSHQHAENAARHWLDVVRYADTNGFSNDFERPHAWRYRDYVIRSFHHDKPFNRFLTEQLAGDELDDSNPENLVATGFLRMGPWEHTSMTIAKVTRQQYLDDVTHSVGVTFLAQGLRCASCHDHKFDPVPTRDYYRLQAAFAPVQFAHRDALYLEAENRSSFDSAQRIMHKRLDEAKRVLRDYNQRNQAAIVKLRQRNGLTSDEPIPDKLKQESHYAGLTLNDLTVRRNFQRRKIDFERNLETFKPLAFSVYNGPTRVESSKAPHWALPPEADRDGPGETTHILTGGAIESPGEQVKPGVLSAASSADGSIPDTLHGRRLALARWMTGPAKSLTARVIVNRIWQQHFAGKGLVRTTNNFGVTGDRPSHPELLDFLTGWFIQHDWSIKELRQLILSSETWSRSAHHPARETLNEIDSTNRLLAYYPVRRLTAEEIRDSLLQASGDLNLEAGGPGTYPDLIDEIAHLTRHVMGAAAPAYQPSALPSERNRRTIYTFRRRTLKDPLMETFNRPTSEISCEARDETTIAPQALALFNGPFVHERAISLANKILNGADDHDIDSGIELVFYRVLGRAPTDDERTQSQRHVRKMLAHHQNHHPQPIQRSRVVRREFVDEKTGGTSHWDEILDQADDYVPGLQPWDVDANVRALSELCLVLMNSNEFLYVE